MKIPTHTTRYEYIPHIEGVPIALMTNRQIINFVADKIEEQGTRCFSEVFETCAYVNEFGQHCAAGWLVPTMPQIDSDWLSLVKNKTIPPHHLALIDSMQSIHDEQWLENADRVHALRELINIYPN